MEFYNPSDKIKQMRKKFRVNQAELEGINMTRAFISMMESGKRSVSKASSKRLVERFKEIADRISVKLDIDDEYFCRQPEEDARYYCENELKDEDKLTHKRLEELIDIEKRFNLDDLLADTYSMSGERYISESDYSKAFIYLNNALGKYKELHLDRKQASVYKSLGFCKLKKSDYEDAVFFYKQAITYAREFDDKLTFFKANHSLAVAYGQMKEYDKCINIIEQNILGSDFKADEIFINNARLMKGNVYLETGKLEEAANEYLQLVEVVRDKDEQILAMLYTNIAEYYYKTRDYVKGLYYINEVQRIRTRSNKAALPYTLNIKAKIIYENGLYDESIMLFDLAIDMAEEYGMFDILINNYKDLVKVLESKNDLDMIRMKMNKLMETLNHHEVEDGKRYAIYKLTEVAALKGDNQKSIELLHQLESFI